MTLEYRVKPNQGAIVLAGSSSIKHWTASAEAFAPYTSVNMGISGSKVTDWLKLYKTLIVDYNPQAVVLYVGGNDIKNSSSLKKGRTTAERVCRLLKRLQKALPGVPIYYVSICQTIKRSDAYEVVALSNSIVQKYCSTSKDLHFIDIASHFWKNGELDETLYMEDGVHPNTAGYKIWKKYVAEKVKKAMAASEEEAIVE